MYSIEVDSLYKILFDRSYLTHVAPGFKASRSCTCLLRSLAQFRPAIRGRLDGYVRDMRAYTSHPERLPPATDMPS